MRVSKKIFSLLILCTTIVGTSPIKTNPTLTTLKWESSEILTDSEGKSPNRGPHFNFNPSNLIYIWPRIEHHYIEDLNFEIRQIDENSFEVLGSPIEWGLVE